MTKDKIFADLADLAGGAASMFSTFRDQIRNDVRDRVDEMAERFDLATRADITRLEGMIDKLRTRLDSYEKSKAPPKKVPPSTTPKSPASKKPSSKKPSSKKSNPKKK
jgi:Membrane fusogenic activity